MSLILTKPPIPAEFSPGSYYFTAESIVLTWADAGMLNNWTLSANSISGQMSITASSNITLACNRLTLDGGTWETGTLTVVNAESVLISNIIGGIYGSWALDVTMCGMTTAEIDAFFNSLATGTFSTSSATIDAAGNNAAPSSASDAARTALANVGITIITN